MVRGRILRTAALLIAVLCIGVALLVAFLEAKPINAPLPGVAQIYNQQTVAETTTTNVIAAINFDWRAYDTMGEATILLTAVTGVAALMRRYLQRRRESGVA